MQQGLILTKEKVQSVEMYISSTFTNFVGIGISYALIRDGIPLVNVIVLILASLISIVMFVEFTLRKKHIFAKESTMLLRYEIFLVIGITVSATTLTALQHPSFVYVPLVFSAVYLEFNVLLKSKIIDAMIKAYMASSILLAYLSFGWSLDFLVCSIVWAILALSVNLVQGIKGAREEDYENGAKKTQAYMEQVSLIKEVNDFMIEFSEHDINNKLSGLQALTMKKYREDRMLSSKFLLQTSSDIIQILKRSKISDTNEEDLNAILSALKVRFNAWCDITVASDPDIKLNINRSILIPVLKNIVTNACQAGKRVGLDKTSIDVKATRDKIVIQDNARGFDTSNIKLGYTTKEGEGHGKFLWMITSCNVSHLFKFKVGVESRVGVGTRTTITFLGDAYQPRIEACVGKELSSVY